jgi:hypothetical protein
MTDRRRLFPMRVQPPKNRPLRKCQPGVEGLDTRDLLSANVMGEAAARRSATAADVAQFVPILYPAGTPQPTAAEVARETFIAKGVGRYTVGPGRFDTQSLTIRGHGKPATSSFSQNMNFQFLIFEPKDTSQTVNGAINFTSRSYLQNGANLVLDLVGPTSTEVGGLPTHLYWAHDAASGTAFNGTGGALPAYGNFPRNYFTADGVPVAPGSANSPGPPSSVNNWNLGIGDATFTYIPDKHPVAGSVASGTVIIVFRGLLNYSGAQSINAPGYS